MKVKSVNICPNNSNAYRITGMTAMGTKILYIGRLAKLPADEIKMLLSWFSNVDETEWKFRFRPASYQFLLDQFSALDRADIVKDIQNAPVHKGKRYLNGRNWETAQ